MSLLFVPLKLTLAKKIISFHATFEKYTIREPDLPPKYNIDVYFYMIAFRFYNMLCSSNSDLRLGIFIVEVIIFVSSRVKVYYSLAFDPPILGSLSRQTEKGFSYNLLRRSFQRLTRKTSITYTGQTLSKNKIL